MHIKKDGISIMKKHRIILAAVVFLQLLLFHCSAHADAADDIYITDTTAYIDGAIIPVYVYNNYPYIVAEDLERYGFDVKWKEEESTLDINYNNYRAFYAYNEAEINIIDKRAGQIYDDENQVRLNGDIIPSYSLGGRMLISLDELWRIGEVNWYDESKTISVTSRKFIVSKPGLNSTLRTVFLSDKINSYVNCSIDTYNEMIKQYNETYSGKPYSQSIHMGSTHRYIFELTKSKLESCYNYISANTDIYKYEKLNNMAYYAIALQDSFMEMYDSINNQTVKYVEANLITIENIPTSDYEQYLHFYNM